MFAFVFIVLDKNYLFFLLLYNSVRNRLMRYISNLPLHKNVTYLDLIILF